MEISLLLKLALFSTTIQSSYTYQDCQSQKDCPAATVCCMAKSHVAGGKNTCRPADECASFSKLSAETKSLCISQQLQSQTNNSEYVTRCGNQLFLGSEPFRWTSFNVPGLLLTEDRAKAPKSFHGFPVCRFPVTSPVFDPNGFAYGSEGGQSCISPSLKDLQSSKPSTPDYTWVAPTPQEQEDAILSIKGAAGKVIRTYTLGFGSGHHVTGPNSFNEEAWVAFDNALDIAYQHNIKLVVPLINNNFKPSDFGSYSQLAAFRSIPASSFFSDPTLRQDMKDIITYMLNRKNTVNGVRYGDDSTLMCLELGNELGGWTDTPPSADWTLDLAKHIKSLSPNMLVMDGTLGGQSAPSRYNRAVLESEFVDLFSNHYYNGHSDIDLVKRDAAFVAKAHSKVFVVGEIGFDDKVTEDIMKLAVNPDSGVTGVMPWSLRYHSQDSGYYEHTEKEGVFSFHVKSGSKMSAMVREYSHAMQNLTMPESPTPIPVRAAAGYIYSPRELRWMGSPWASSYVLERTSKDASGSAVFNVTDTVKFGSVLYADSSAQPGVEYMYAVYPVSMDGAVNRKDPLNIGPVKM